MTTTDAQAPPEGQESPPTGPVPLLEGTFALYEWRGGFMVVWRKKGEPDVRRRAIPRMILETAARMGGADPETMINEMFGAVKAA